MRIKPWSITEPTEKLEHQLTKVSQNIDRRLKLKNTGIRTIKFTVIPTTTQS